MRSVKTFLHMYLISRYLQSCLRAGAGLTVERRHPVPVSLSTAEVIIEISLS